MPSFGDDGVDLVSGQLTAFAGLCALRDLDLELLRVHQILGGDAEARRCNLLDRAIAVGAKARTLLATFTAIAATADAVHGDGERLVCFGAERAERHRAGAEAARDRLRRLGFLDWD